MDGRLRMDGYIQMVAVTARTKFLAEVSSPGKRKWGMENRRLLLFTLRNTLHFHTYLTLSYSKWKWLYIIQKSLRRVIFNHYSCWYFFPATPRQASQHMKNAFLRMGPGWLSHWCPWDIDRLSKPLNFQVKKETPIQSPVNSRLSTHNFESCFHGKD